MAKQRLLAVMLEPVRPGVVSPDRAMCLPTFSYLLIVNNNFSLSLSLSLFSLGSRNLRPRVEARLTGCAVSRERLGDWDGPLAV
jgi:hypothetical protein